MDIYIYADESGVFDKNNSDFYVYGGVIFLSKEDRDNETNKYIGAETVLRANHPKYRKGELKASRLTNKDKGKLFRSTNSCIRYGIIVNQKRINDNIFNHKKSKQRYLDYAFKIGVKKTIQKLMDDDLIIPTEVNNILVFVDEHTTATDGLYELREGLLEEFKNGTFNFKYDKFFQPLFPQMNNVDVCYCNSEKQALIRVSDIVANRVYYHSISNKLDRISDKVFLTYLP